MNSRIRLYVFTAIFLLSFVGLWMIYPYLFKSLLFAVLCAFFAELLAILLSELGLFLYTKINFLEIDDWVSKARLLSLIFISVHILVAIIFSMMFWSNIT